MPAWTPGGLLGIKTVDVSAGNAARGLPGLHAGLLLYDAQTGVPVAQLDGDQITWRRTAAASALAARYLAPAGAQHLLVVGAGRIGACCPRPTAPPCPPSTTASPSGAATPTRRRPWPSGCEPRTCRPPPPPTCPGAAAQADIVGRRPRPPHR